MYININIYIYININQNKIPVILRAPSSCGKKCSNSVAHSTPATDHGHHGGMAILIRTMLGGELPTARKWVITPVFLVE